jgi:hypothetical protein
MHSVRTMMFAGVTLTAIMGLGVVLTRCEKEEKVQ